MTQGQQSLSHFSSDVVWQTFNTFASPRKRLFNGHGRPWQVVMTLQVDVDKLKSFTASPLWRVDLAFKIVAKSLASLCFHQCLEATPNTSSMQISLHALTIAVPLQLNDWTLTYKEASFKPCHFLAPSPHSKEHH